jgi:hypothetical protein
MFNFLAIYDVNWSKKAVFKWITKSAEQNFDASVFEKSSV